MNIKGIKIINLICFCIILFLVINILIPNKVSASNVKIVKNTIQFNNSPQTVAGATLLKTVVLGGQILISGYYVTRITIEGIRYFISVAANEKAEHKNAIGWNVFLAVITLLGFEIVIKLLGY